MVIWSIFAAALASLQGPSTMVHSRAVGGEPEERVGYRRDPNDRMTVPVTIGEHGPYRFVVDTGAERTVISRELADQLQLGASRPILLTSVVDVQRVPTVIIPRLNVGRRTVADIQAPALAQQHLGAQGMLGVDSLQSQRVTFDFRRRELRLARSVVEDDAGRPTPSWCAGERGSAAWCSPTSSSTGSGCGRSSIPARRSPSATRRCASGFSAAAASSPTR
jgi:predicted aspartyl protease